VSLNAFAEEMRKHNIGTRDLLLHVRQFIIDHAGTIPHNVRREPKSIIESRFTTAQEAFDSGMLSCGAMANIAAEVLRNVGYEVRFVHGECKESVDHAWISVRALGDDNWVEFDVTRPALDIPSTHIRKTEVTS